MYTIFGTKTLDRYTVRSYVRRNSVGGSGGEASQESRGVRGAARPSTEGMVGGEGFTVNGFWGMVPSWGMVKVGLMAGGRAGGRMGGWADGRMGGCGRCIFLMIFVA